MLARPRISIASASCCLRVCREGEAYPVARLDQTKELLGALLPLVMSLGWPGVLMTRYRRFFRVGIPCHRINKESV